MKMLHPLAVEMFTFGLTMSVTEYVKMPMRIIEDLSLLNTTSRKVQRAKQEAAASAARARK